MPPVTATSSVAKVVASAKSLVSNSSTFQTRTGSANATEALDHIYLYEYLANEQTEADAALNDPVVNANNDRPYAIVMLAEDVELSAVPGYEACVGLNLLLNAGALVVLQATARYSYVPGGQYYRDDSYLDFLNFVGGVCDDLSGKLNDVNYGDLYGFRRINFLLEPTRSEDKVRHQDDFWTAWLVLSKGDR